MSARREGPIYLGAVLLGAMAELTGDELVGLASILRVGADPPGTSCPNAAFAGDVARAATFLRHMVRAVEDLADELGPARRGRGSDIPH